MTPSLTPDPTRPGTQGEEMRQFLEAQLSWTAKYGKLTLHQLTDRLEAAEAEASTLRERVAKLEDALRFERASRLTAIETADHWQARYGEACNGPNG